ncbi:hypothetical protein RRG08_008930 [Elysia crispata]|uniref:Uncharacterized protein n=1 Tax=Elysia crispata TaxID=231223 RepID=A0AAE0ZWP7_9GAST|nr:hypothetical protein RRG08_008930 [Elysia crispata]
MLFFSFDTPCGSAPSSNANCPIRVNRHAVFSEPFTQINTLCVSANREVRVMATGSDLRSMLSRSGKSSEAKIG